MLIIAICIISLKKDESSKLLKSFIEQEQKRVKTGSRSVDSIAAQTAGNPQARSASSSTSGINSVQTTNGGQEENRGLDEPDGSDSSKCIYKRNPVYGNMKKCLKGANLSDRKYRRLKKELIKECS